MANNYVQPGAIITWTNATGSAVSAGDVVTVGRTLGVALVDIANAASGSVAIKGVFSVPKVSGAVIAQGEPLVWDASANSGAGEFDDVDASGNSTGDVKGNSVVAFEAAGDGATTLKARFTGVPGTVA